MIEKGSGEMVAATIRTVFAQTTAEQVRTQPDVVADMLGRQFPQVKRMLLDAATDITAFADFPRAIAAQAGPVPGASPRPARRPGTSGRW